MKTITVRQLIRLLQDEDQDADVVFTADYGDYHHTQQALPINGEIEEAVIGESAYSNSGWALVPEMPDNIEDRKVLVIR